MTWWGEWERSGIATDLEDLAYLQVLNIWHIYSFVRSGIPRCGTSGKSTVLWVWHIYRSGISGISTVLYDQVCIQACKSWPKHTGVKVCTHFYAHVVSNYTPWNVLNKKGLIYTIVGSWNE